MTATITYTDGLTLPPPNQALAGLVLRIRWLPGVLQGGWLGVCEEGADRVGGCRACQVVSLCGVAAEAADEGECGGVFDAFGDDLESEPAGEFDRAAE